MSLLCFKQTNKFLKLLNRCLAALFFVATIAQPLRAMESAVQITSPLGMLTDATQGVWTQYDKHGTPVILEWYKVTDYQTFFDLEEMLIPTQAEVFADEPKDLRDFLLDDTLQIKEEYAAIIESLSTEEREELYAKIATSGADREIRVESTKQALLQQLEKARAHLLITPQDLGTSFVVIVKNEEGDIWGFAIFRFPEHDVASLDLLGVMPSAQGKGLARILVFSILKLAPETKYIFLGTEIWNTQAQAVYKALGFTIDKQRGCYVSFEYEVKS